MRLVLVDFDDTLVDTAPRFQNARRALFDLLTAEGFDAGVVHRVHHDEVDREMVDRYGFGPLRLEPSFRETYLRLCALEGWDPDPAVVARCVAIARDVIGPPPCYDGAIEALARLAAHVDTAIYTQAGDPDYQFDCIRKSGVLDVVPADRIRICRRKTVDEYRATLAHFGVADPGAACMVGNSIRSDINPALTVGSRAILVEVEDPWIFDVVEPVSGSFARVRRFPEAVDLLVAPPESSLRPDTVGHRVSPPVSSPRPGVESA